MRKTSILVVFGVALIMLSVPFVSAEQVHIQYKLPDNLSSIPSWMNVYGEHTINSNHKLELTNIPNDGGRYYNTYNQIPPPTQNVTSVIVKNFNYDMNVTKVSLWYNFTLRVANPVSPDDEGKMAWYLPIEIGIANFSSSFHTLCGNYFATSLTIGQYMNGSEVVAELLPVQYKSGDTIGYLPFLKLYHNVSNPENFRQNGYIEYINIIHMEYIKNATVGRLLYYFYGEIKTSDGASKHTTETLVENATTYSLKLHKKCPYNFSNGTMVYITYQEGIVYAKGTGNGYNNWNYAPDTKYAVINSFNLDIYGIGQPNTGGNGNNGSNTGGNGNNGNNNPNSTNPIIGSKIKPYYPLTYNIGLILGIVIITMVIATDIYIHRKFP